MRSNWAVEAMVSNILILCVGEFVLCSFSRVLENFTLLRE